MQLSAARGKEAPPSILVPAEALSLTGEGGRGNELTTSLKKAALGPSAMHHRRREEKGERDQLPTARGRRGEDVLLAPSSIFSSPFFRPLSICCRRQKNCHSPQFFFPPAREKGGVDVEEEEEGTVGVRHAQSFRRFLTLNLRMGGNYFLIYFQAGVRLIAPGRDLLAGRDRDFPDPRPREHHRSPRRRE